MRMSKQSQIGVEGKLHFYGVCTWDDLKLCMNIAADHVSMVDDFPFLRNSFGGDEL